AGGSLDLDVAAASKGKVLSGFSGRKSSAPPSAESPPAQWAKQALAPTLPPVVCNFGRLPQVHCQRASPQRIDPQ
ncbi:hypothetical protein BaRGS_00024439, partial [Batillaria attramentaria]